MADAFPHCARKAGSVAAGASDLASYDDLRELLCSDCEFYDPEEDEELECSSFKLLRRLLDMGRLTAKDLLDAATG